jgi:Protein of unknown function (DUF3152)
VVACGPERLYTYRIASRGPVTADLGQFERHVAATLEDPRGWSLGGSLAFQRTDGPADLTIWLASAGSLPSFSSTCSSQWSCRAGPNVVINEDRWTGATGTWPYDLDSYQHYVVNHEVGHWLGFGHRSCTAAGARAPVMVQQSKGGAILGPCRFNVWPLDEELDAAAANHGVGRRPTGLASPDDPFGSVDATDVARGADGRPRSVRVTGWAVDGDSSSPLLVVVNVDGRPVSVVRADEDRPDLAVAFPRHGASHGFDVAVGVEPEARVVCLDALGVGAGEASTSLGCSIVK